MGVASVGSSYFTIMGHSTIWIMGGPGSGKGSTCKLIADEFSYVHLSTGDLLRKEVLAGTERWIRLHDLIIKGELAPDEEVTDLLLDAMGKHSEAKAFLIDGFPASIEQAKICEEKLGKPQKIIVLEAPEDVLEKRLQDGDNFNDAVETIPRRIKTYRETTYPVIDAHAGVCKKVKADRPLEEVYADIKEILQA